MSGQPKNDIKQTTLFIVAIVLILFSFVSPYIFTRPGSIDFSNTGQIGDTIGGLMSPFIAIAGVIVAFLAFWMQKQANDIIVAQFNKKIELDEQIEKTRKKRLVELLRSDVDTVKKDIEVRLKAIHEFQEELTENPFQTRTLIRTPVSFYLRMSKLDREMLFDALIYSGSSDTIKLLNAFYSIPDYLIPALNHIYNSMDAFEADVYRGLTQIRDNTLEIIKTSLDRGWFNENEIECLKEFSDAYHSAHDNSPDRFFRDLKNNYIELECQISELVHNNEDYHDTTSLLIVQEYLRQIVSSYNSIEQQTIQSVNNIDDAVRGLGMITQRCDYVLSKTSSIEG